MSIDVSRLSPAAQAQIAKKLVTQQNKYHARKAERIVNGEVIKFASEKEAKRYDELFILERSGTIKDLRMQVPFELTPSQTRDDGSTERPCKYIADFVYWDSRCERVIVEDVKGYKNSAAYALFAVKRKIMLHKYGISVREI